MAWERSVGQVRITWLWGSWPAPLYQRGNGGYRHVCLPPGLWIRWIRRNEEYDCWDALEQFMTRAVIAVFLGVLLGLILSWWVLP